MGATSRRAFLASAPAAALLGGRVRAAPATGLPMLGKELERLWAIEDSIEGTATCAQFECATDASSAIVQRILAEPAKTLDDLKVKALALSWCYSAGDIDLFEPDQQTTDVLLVKSIISDLIAAWTPQPPISSRGARR